MESSSSLVQNDSLDGAAKGESEQPADMMEIYPQKLERASDLSMNLGSHGRKTEESKPTKVVYTGGDENKGSKKTVLTQEDVASCAKGDIELEDSPPTKS